jgi:hypothetical protein
MTEPRAASPEKASDLLQSYRADHRIVPVGPRYDETCDVCKVRVDRIKGGYRHQISELRVLIEKAPLGFPRERP